MKDGIAIYTIITKRASKSQRINHLLCYLKIWNHYGGGIMKHVMHGHNTIS